MHTYTHAFHNFPGSLNKLHCIWSTTSQNKALNILLFKHLNNIHYEFSQLISLFLKHCRKITVSHFKDMGTKGKKRLMSPGFWRQIFCEMQLEARAHVSGKNSPKHPWEIFTHSWGNNEISKFPGFGLTLCSAPAALKLDLFYRLGFSCCRKQRQRMPVLQIYY